jgi:hypothetical protein
VQNEAKRKGGRKVKKVGRKEGRRTNGTERNGTEGAHETNLRVQREGVVRGGMGRVAKDVYIDARAAEGIPEGREEGGKGWKEGRKGRKGGREQGRRSI